MLVTHSHAGQYGWVLADARPGHVKAIIALEPFGPPFVTAVFPPFTEVRPFGLSDIALEYSPPVMEPRDLEREIAWSDSFHVCYRQAHPPRQLKNVKEIPVLVVTSESGYHAVYDSCTTAFLRQAGVRVDHIELKDIGIRGNGHMFFMEMNNLVIARDVVHSWIVNQSLAIRGNLEETSAPFLYHLEL